VKVKKGAKWVQDRTAGQSGFLGDINRVAGGVGSVADGTSKLAQGAQAAIGKADKIAGRAAGFADRVLKDKRLEKGLETGLKAARKARDLAGGRLAKDTASLAQAQLEHKFPLV
jgi:X-X-X-Leu-X-X-Gly heptad repeat protein